MKYFIPLMIFFSYLVFFPALLFANESIEKNKIQGMHFFSKKPLDDKVVGEFKELGINWLILVPYGYQRKYNSPEIRYSTLSGYEFSERDKGIIQISQKAQENKLKIVIKPHIWLWKSEDNKWRAEIDFSPEDIKKWQSNYTKWILYYANLSNKIKAEMLCIGTELKTIVNKYPGFWLDLINKVRSVYKGKLCYAANWYEEFKEVSFWNELDYIGIQAYFPLVKKEGANKSELKRGWEKPLKEIEKLSKKWNKPVLFTELGYKSTTDTAIEPWLWGWDVGSHVVDNEAQKVAYEAFFETFWPRKWFAGVLLWQWKNQDRKHRLQEVGFTPQGKPTLRVIQKWFNR